MKKYSSGKLMEPGSCIHLFSAVGIPTEPLHCHDFLEMVYVTAGSARQTVDEKQYLTLPGDLLFLNYGCVHGFDASNDFGYINICFAPEVMTQALPSQENSLAILQRTAFDAFCRGQDSGVVSFRGLEKEETDALMRAMLREYGERHAAWRTALDGYMNLLMARILRTEAPDGSKGAARETVWQSISEYINRHPDADLTLPTLAGKCFYNPSYFSRAFREHFRMTLTDYVNQKKVGFAKTLASDPSLTTQEVAMRSGFSSMTTFYRTFLKVAGIGFGEYRLSCRRDEKM